MGVLSFFQNSVFCKNVSVARWKIAGTLGFDLFIGFSITIPAGFSLNTYRKRSNSPAIHQSASIPAVGSHIYASVQQETDPFGLEEHTAEISV